MPPAVVGIEQRQCRLRAQQLGTRASIHDAGIDQGDVLGQSCRAV